jgi:nucleoside-diphosphate-sugar epimerase
LLFGEGDPGNFLRLIRIAARRRMIYLDGGRARKSLTYVGNVGPAIEALVARRLPPGRCYSLADRRPLTVREILHEICHQLGVPGPRVSLPAPLARALGRIGSGVAAAGLPIPIRLDVVETLMRDSIVDTTPLEEETGFFPPISFAEGVGRTIEWCRDQGIVS